jgi:tetratricopeptide (TPR) repeat protein
MSALARFIAREYDRIAGHAAERSWGAHPDENDWALLADGLVSAAQRDALVLHAAACPACRRRMSAVVREFPDHLVFANGKPVQWPAQRGAIWRLIVHPRVRYALAACLMLAVAGGLYFALRPSGRDLTLVRQTANYGIDTARLLAASVALTDLGVDIRRRTTREENRALLGEAEYRTVLTKLAPGLSKERPTVDALALATRAALSAHFYSYAEEYARRWGAAAPTDAAAANAEGLAAYQLNRFDVALQAFSRAISLAPSNAEFHLNAALAGAEAGQPAAFVRRQLEEFRRWAPTDARLPEVERWLKKLNGTGP